MWGRQGGRWALGPGPRAGQDSSPGALAAGWLEGRPVFPPIPSKRDRDSEQRDKATSGCSSCTAERKLFESEFIMSDQEEASEVI